MAGELYYGCSQDGYFSIIRSMHLQGNWDQICAGHAEAMDGGDTSKATLATGVRDGREGDRRSGLGSSNSKCLVIAGCDGGSDCDKRLGLRGLSDPCVR